MKDFSLKAINNKNNRIMKKKYFAPGMKIVKMRTNHFLTASPLGYGNPVSTAAGAEAPGFDDFDDFDE